MKKVMLLEVRQHGKRFFIGKYDPRLLVQMADPSIDNEGTQQAQRPLERKRLREIARYVGQKDKGFLPASVMLGTSKNSPITVQKDSGDWYYAMFPETPEELRRYACSIDIIDGQHRLFAFAPKYLSEKMKNSIRYEIPFSLFTAPTLKLRRELFTVTNEKQKAVNSNLLMYLRKKLGMLDVDDEKRYRLVSELNKNPLSPLRGRIIMSAEKITKGYKANQLMRIIDKSKLDRVSINGVPCSEKEQVVAICTYLKAWEEHQHLEYANPGKETMTKISGLRYVLFLLPTFIEYSVSSQNRFTKEFVLSVIRNLKDSKGLTEEQTLFDNALDFRGEGATVKRATDDAQRLKEYLTSRDTGGFNPFA